MKAGANELCIAISSGFSKGVALPTIADEIRERFNVSFSVNNQYDWFLKWNEFIDAAEKKTDRSEIFRYVRMRQCIAALAASSIPFSTAKWR